jgi:hypothetical protein
MSITLAELKGLAVGRMNADPVVPLRTGHSLPRNFVIDTEHRWGFPALRFGDTIHLLSIPSLPAGIDEALTGKQSFAVIHHLEPDELRRPLLGLPTHPVSLFDLLGDPTEAVETAASARSGEELIKLALSGEFSEPDRKETPPARSTVSDEEIDRSLYDYRDMIPPSIEQVDKLLSLFRRVHGEKPENALRLQRLMARPGLSFTQMPGLLLGDRFQVFGVANVPGAAFSEEGEEPDRNLEYRGIVVAKLNHRERELAFGRAFPAVPISVAGPVAIYLTWGEAIARAALEWLLDEHHREFEAKLGHSEDQQ